MPRKTNLKVEHFNIISDYHKTILNNKKVFTYYNPENIKMPVGDIIEEINEKLKNINLKPLARNTITKYIPISDNELSKDKIEELHKSRKVRKDKDVARKDKLNILPIMAATPIEESIASGLAVIS
jgi:hypothetical protein